jgi:hypothetical protein
MGGKGKNTGFEAGLFLKLIENLHVGRKTCGS